MVEGLPNPSFEQRRSRHAAGAKLQIADDPSQNEVDGSLDPVDNSSDDDSDGEYVARVQFGDSESVPI